MVTALRRPVRLGMAFAGLLVLAGLVRFQPVRAQTAASPARPMTFLDMQLMRQRRLADAEPGRPWMLYTCRRRTGGSETPDRPLSRVDAGGRVVDQADDVHQGEERNVAARGRATAALSVPVEPRGAASAATQNQIYMMRPDGGEARRITDTQGRRRGFRLERGRQVARLSSGRERRAAALSPADAGIENAERRAAHQASRPACDSWAMVLPTARASISSARTASTPTRRRGGRRSSRSTSATPRRRPPSLWALDCRSAQARRG